MERDSKGSSIGEAVGVMGSNEERDLCRPGGRGMTGTAGLDGAIGYGRIGGRQEALPELGFRGPSSVRTRRSRCYSVVGSNI